MYLTAIDYRSIKNCLDVKPQNIFDKIYLISNFRQTYHQLILLSYQKKFAPEINSASTFIYDKTEIR